MDIQKKKMLQEKIYKTSQQTLKKIVDCIFKNHPDIKYTKTLNGYFFNMNYIDESVLWKMFEIINTEEVFDE
jgi:hypothetical protein